MMLSRDLTPRDGSQPGVLRRKRQAGPAFLAAFAGLAVLGAGTATVALIGIHSAPAFASSVCQALPTAPSSPAPGPTSSLNPGGSVSSVPESGSASAAAASAAATQLCVTVAAVASSVQPGHPAQYTITVQSTGGTTTDVTVQVSASSGFPAPTFNVCGSGDGTQTCTLGTMSANKAIQLQAQDAVPSSASSGGSVTLTAKVTGVAKGATTQGSVSGIASVSVVAPPPTTPTTTKPTGGKTPSDHDHHNSGGGGGGGSGGNSGGSGSGQGSGQGSGTDTGVGTKLGFSPGDTLGTGGFNPLGGLGGTGSGTDPSSLFPTISPSPGTSGTGGSTTPATSGGRAPYHPTSVADVLPLNTGQVGGQIAGLIVLALGIIVAVVRVSVRKPRTQDKQ
jgi:hypothetical protein